MCNYHPCFQDLSKHPDCNSVPISTAPHSSQPLAPPLCFHLHESDYSRHFIQKESYHVRPLPLSITSSRFTHVIAWISPLLLFKADYIPLYLSHSKKWTSAIHLQRGQLPKEFTECPQGKQNVGSWEEEQRTALPAYKVETARHLPQPGRGGGISKTWETARPVPHMRKQVAS